MCRILRSDAGEAVDAPPAEPVAGDQARVGEGGVGHRKIWALTRQDGHKASRATVLRLLCDDGLILPSEYQKQRRGLAKDRTAAFAKKPTGPNQLWRLGFSEFETCRAGPGGSRVPESVLEGRAPVPRLADCEPVRRDRGDRARPRRL